MQNTKESIAQMVEQSAGESETLEFKRELPKTKDHKDKAEFAKDVVGMANSSGGVILYGIASHEDCATKLMPITDEAADAAARRLEMTLASAIEPKELRVKFRPIEVDGGYVMELTVPRSFAGPHRVIADNKSHFYFRSNTQVRPFTYGELREAFLGRERASQEFRNWRDWRINNIKDNAGPRFVVEGDPLLVIHASPLEAFERRVSVDPTTLYDSFARFFNADGSVSRNYNLDGIVAYRDDGTEITSEYAQVFRTAQVEFVSNCRSRSRGGQRLSASSIAWAIRDSIQRYAKLFMEMEYLGPVVFAVSLLKVNSWVIQVNSWSEAKSDRDELVFPEVVVASPTEVLEDLDSVARPLLDTVWQAFDSASCPFYGSTGVFTVK